MLALMELLCCMGCVNQIFIDKGRNFYGSPFKFMGNLQEMENVEPHHIALTGMDK